VGTGRQECLQGTGEGIARVVAGIRTRVLKRISSTLEAGGTWMDIVQGAALGSLVAVLVTPARGEIAKGRKTGREKQEKGQE